MGTFYYLARVDRLWYEEFKILDYKTFFNIFDGVGMTCYLSSYNFIDLPEVLNHPTIIELGKEYAFFSLLREGGEKIFRDEVLNMAVEEIYAMRINKETFWLALKGIEHDIYEKETYDRMLKIYKEFNWVNNVMLVWGD